MDETIVRIRGFSVPAEVSRAADDADRIAEDMQELTKAIAFIVAISTRGDPAEMNEFLEATSQHMFELAADFAVMGKLKAMIDSHPRKKAN